MIHEIKCPKRLFQRLLSGTKTFWDADSALHIQMGDTVIFKEWDDEPINPTSPEPKGFTESPNLEFKVGYVDSLTSVISLLRPNKSKVK